ncbi:MAG: hypothetical protein R3234_08785, partial [Thermoanaerobaculia bacterium]|nr:hypothetical protein [Thermoanaerobaculia bacterium]
MPNPATEPGPDEGYTVWAHHPFHLSGEAEKYRVGTFGACDEALETCRRVVEEFLESSYQDGMSAEHLMAEYEASGPDPYIEPRGEGCLFRARAWARERVAEICAPGGRPE